MDNQTINKNVGSVPVPDPTLLTTTQLLREISNLKELHQTKIEYIEVIRGLIRDIVETRLDGMDKAIRLLQDTADKFPSRIDEKIDSLRQVHDEKFTSVQLQFRERDTRIEQTSKDSKTAVDAALQAAEKAVAKSETSTLKQIDQQGLLIQTGNKATDDKINDIKDRVGKIEGIAVGALSQKTEQQTTSSSIWAIIAIVASILFGILGYVIHNK